MNKFITTFLLSICVYSVFPQAGWDWGDNKTEAEQQYVLLSTSTKGKQYAEALPALTYLLEHAPKLNKALYQNATKVYEGLASKEKDNTKKKAYQDAALKMYDDRIKYFGQEAQVLNYKGRVAYAYLINRADKKATLYPFYKKVYELNNVNTKTYNMNYYFQLSGAELKAGNLTEEKLLSLYNDMSEKMDKQAAAQKSEKKRARILKGKDKLDESLTKYVTVDCEFVKNTYQTKFEQAPDLKLAKKIYSLMAGSKCLSDSLFIQTSEYVLEQEPSYSGFRLQAKVYEKNKDFEKAIVSFEKAVALATSDEEKAETNLDIAKAYNYLGKKETAREYAYKVIAINSEQTEAYELIGNLYMYSSSSCSGDDRLKASLIYIAAYDKYRKAGNSTKMSEAKKYFPSVEEMFARGKKEGDTMNTGCWVGETVTLKKR
ncbi:MAG: tetratricopeptide repeat protein [Cyclobacteriaceae bacterium]